jgi:putative DNA primase/helicase
MRKLTPEDMAALQSTQAPRVSTEVLNLSGVQPMNQPFLWYPYLPLGRLVIVAGAPGHGKSQLAAMIAGMASRGDLYPGEVTEPSRVLMLCAEDDLPMTVVPRLLAVNADLRLIDTINIVTTYPDGLTAKGLIKLPTDASIVHEWVKANPNARLIVLDPVASFFDRSHNMLVNQDTRDALGPLVAIAESYGVTIVIILHLNKSESKDFANRIAESHGFQALARSVLALGPHPDDPERERGARKVLAVTKANLVKPGNYAMECEVRSATLSAYTPPIETSELVLVGKCNVTADDLLMPSIERADRNAKLEWLNEFLDGEWRKTEDVKKAATSDGWAWKQLNELAKTKGFVRQKIGFQGQWWIGPPKADPRAIPEYPGSKEPLDVFDDPKDSNEHKDPGYSGPPREGINGLDLDEYRKFRDRMLGERDDEDDEG